MARTNTTDQARTEPSPSLVTVQLTAAASMAAVISAIPRLEMVHGPALGLSAQIRTANRPGQEEGR